VTNTDQTSAQGPEGLQRRTIVKAGAHAAWAVPAITIATAAPAFAGSTQSSVSVGLLTSASRSGSTLTVSNGSISNTGLATTQNLQVTVQLVPTGVGGGADFRNATVTTTPNGFSVSPNPSVNNAAKSITYTFVAGSQLSGPLGSTSFNPVFNLVNANAGQIIITPTVSNGTGSSASRTFT
jgi:hypothetical protein